MKLVANVIGIQKWDGSFTDKTTGEVVTATPYTKFLDLKLDSVTMQDNRFGLEVCEYKGDRALWDKIRASISFPAKLELSFDIRPIKNGTMIWVTDCKALS